MGLVLAPLDSPLLTTTVSAFQITQPSTITDTATNALALAGQQRTLHMPEMWGIDDWGVWLMGVVAVVWTVDCFVGFYLTLPVKRANCSSGSWRQWWLRWKPAWKVKTTGSFYRANFDIHRASGLWTWALLFILAFTGFSLNLYKEVFYPLMSLVSQVTPTPFDLRERVDRNHPIEPRLNFDDMLALARAEGERRQWPQVAGIFYSPSFGVYTVQFSDTTAERTGTGLPPPRLFFDGQDGRALGEREPWKGTAAGIFVQAQFPLLAVGQR